MAQTESELAYQQYLDSQKGKPVVVAEGSAKNDDDAVLKGSTHVEETSQQRLARLAREAEEAKGALNDAQANQFADDNTYIRGVREAEGQVDEANEALKAASGLEDVQGMENLPSMPGSSGNDVSQDDLDALRGVLGINYPSGKPVQDSVTTRRDLASPVDRYGHPMESKVRPEGFPPTPAKNRVARLLTDEDIRSLAESGEFPADLEYREEPREYGGVTRLGTEPIGLPFWARDIDSPFPQRTPIEEMYSRLGNEYEREDFLRKRRADVLRERAEREKAIDFVPIAGKAGELAQRYLSTGIVPGGALISKYAKPFVEDEIIGRAKQIMQNLERLEELESERDVLRKDLEQLQAEASDQSYRGE